MATTGLKDLAFPDSEHHRPETRADTLGCGLTILHRDGLGILHLSLDPAFQAIGFHHLTSIRDQYFLNNGAIG